MEDLSWLSDAACRDVRKPSFISSDYEDIVLAKEICETCPVIEPCMLTNYDAVGVIAGTSDFDRLKLRWKRIDDVRDSNWRPVDSILEGFIQKV